MFYYLIGSITHIEQNLAVVDCGGVGYAVRTSSRSLAELRLNERAKLYTYAHVKEDVFEIYGFYDLRELNAFKLLISVSGVGVRSALSVLSQSTPEDLAVSIAAGDETLLTSAPGIGRKTAQRIILELKDKVTKDMPSVDAGNASRLTSEVMNEVSAALTVLGYTATEIKNAIQSAAPDDLKSNSASEIIRAILKRSV